MIYLLGGSGYVGQAYQELLKAKGLTFKSIARKDLDYSNVAALRGALEADKPEFLINAAGSQANRTSMPAKRQDELPFGNAILLGRIARPAKQPAPHGARFIWLHLHRGTRGWNRVHRRGCPKFHFRQNNCSFYSGTKALGRDFGRRQRLLHLAPENSLDHRESPRSYLTKLMRYQRYYGPETPFPT